MDAPENLTLDPSDWPAFRKLAHAALDDAIDFVENVRERPVWQPVPDNVRARLTEGLPLKSTPLDEVYQQFKDTILPYATGNVNPRFFGWVHGSGQVGNIVAETMAAAMNCNCGGRDHGAIYVEHEIIEWCKQLYGFPDGAGGLIVSGTSMANLIAMGAARNSLKTTYRSQGFDAKTEDLVVYASREVHESIVKTLEILGLGSSSLRRVAVQEDFSIDVEDLKRSIEADRAAGKHPLCCIGCAGTVNSGAIDDLQALADICASENLWFHVDGAFGALCAMSDKLKHRVDGIERADSIAFDFHKWAHVQYDAGCVLLRDSALHRAAYSMRPPYLENLAKGLGGGQDWPCDYGPELSRSFRALKIWFALKQHGVRLLGELIEQNCEQAKYLADLVAGASELELLAPVDLNIVCFRALDRTLDAPGLDALNQRIVEELQLSGVAAPSTTRINGKLAIRVNITNHRTTIADLDLLVASVRDLLAVILESSGIAVSNSDNQS